MTVTVKYEMSICKNVIADDDKDDGENGYDTVNQRTADEVDKIVQPVIKDIKNKLPDGCTFNLECHYTIEED